MKIKPLEWQRGEFAIGAFGNYQIYCAGVGIFSCHFDKKSRDLEEFATSDGRHTAQAACQEHHEKLIREWLIEEPTIEPQGPTITGHLTGRCNIDTEQPSMIISTTREEIQRAGNWLYKPVTVRGPTNENP